MSAKTAITPTRGEDYAEWYQQVVLGADMAESSPVRGCMIVKPWGWAIWEQVRDDLDRRIRDTGHDNCYFPLFIPLRFLEKEAQHVEGFAKEMAVVTHHRLTARDGKLVPDGALEEPLVVRPTSETIIGEAMAKWIQSYRDLPLLLNQWANVVRWEMRPRIFLRTSEFLWQEGHTAHADEADAWVETKKMLEVYRQTVEEVMAIPVIMGEKPESERFPGAVSTLCIEAMMQDGRALQAGTSHYLGQNFAKAAEIRYQTKEGGLEYAHTTSWGVSTRLIGALIMTHSDDDGLRLPPRIAPRQIVISPMIRKDADREAVMDFCEKLEAALKSQSYAGQPIRAFIDRQDVSSADKKWRWIRRGAPILCEIGPRDVAQGSVFFSRRDKLGEKLSLSFDDFVAQAAGTLAEMQQGLFDRALALREARTVRHVTTLEQFKAYFVKDEGVSFEQRPGFVRAKWSCDPASEAVLKELGVTIRCLPFDQDKTPGTCVLTGAPATVEAIFARSY